MAGSAKRPHRRQVILAVFASSLILSFPYICFRTSIKAQTPWLRFQTPRTASEIDFDDHAEDVPNSVEASSTLDPLCDQRMGNGYIEDFIPTATNYCDDDSTTKLTCFHNKAFQKADSFCIGDGALFNTMAKRFSLDCGLRPLTSEEKAKGIPSFYSFPQYWYETGPRYIFSKFFNVNRRRKPRQRPVETEGSVKILIKREENKGNIWHTMMEIMALSLTLDVLRQATNADAGKPFWSSKDAKNSQIVFLDDLPESPYDDLWETFTGVQSTDLAGFSQSSSAAVDNIKSDDMRVIVPLPGSANPFWQGQWADMHCGQSPLLQSFSHRVLDHYNLTVDDSSTAPRSKKRVVTIADRTAYRRLINQDVFVDELKRKYDDIEFQVIDFGTLSLRHQVEIAHGTDILVGPHGAGLTHSFFLPSGSTVVEISPPGTMIQTFDLVAQALGHRYLHRVGSGQYRNEHWTGDWQTDDIFLEQSQFMEMMDEAIRGARV